ncbi:hypothetical protein J2Y89_001589 [Curtobacterium herbarum]|uniref:MmpS family transport accessory protein n=1 Tax=Curtobacterium herbarum TaxID=150122 RepID=UPI0020A18A71|nr:MmpS family transport accessory protein [Curtobacterium herbarum]MCP1502845.1 hypothetical protein [Curtobacterium herbarum]
MAQYQPAPVMPDQTPPKRSSPLGLTALIIGIVAIIGCAIPIVNFISIFLGVVAVVLGIIAIVQKNRTHGLAIAGAILGAIALIVGIATASVYAAAFNSVSDALETSAPVATDPAAPSTDAPAPSDAASDTAAKPVAGDRTVHYEVTSDGKTLNSVTYLTFNNGASSTEQANGTAAPFSKDVKIEDDGLFESSLFSLVAQAGEDATTITCKITADGKTIQEATSTGPYAVATCSGSAE